MRITFLFTLMMLFIEYSATANESANTLVIPASVQTVLNNRCIDCHNAETHEGQIRLDTLDRLDLAEQLDLLNKAQDQLFLD